MQHSKFNTRKRFINEREPENGIPPKLPNKRTVFEDEDPPAEPAPQLVPNEQPERPDFIMREFSSKPIFWRLLQIRGPYLLSSYLPSNVFLNRAFYHLIREISEQLYHNFVKYQQNEALIEADQVMNMEQILSCLKAMKEKTMKYENKLFSVYFSTQNILFAIQSLLMRAPPPVVLNFNDFSALLEQLRSICQKQNVAVSESDLVSFRNALVRYLSHVQSDFVVWLTNSSLQNREWFPADTYKKRGDMSILIKLSALVKVSIHEMRRDSQEPSLWLTVCCSGQAQLLEHVFMPGLLEFLPWNVKEFLTNWMEKVQKRMRKRWTNGDLKKVMDVLLDSEDTGVPFSSPAIREFLKKMCDNVLNCNEDFKVFGEKALDSMEDTLSHMVHANNIGNRKWFLDDFFASLGFGYLASLFPRNAASCNMLRHVKTQLFNFFLLFCYHTIRFVLLVDIRERRFEYTGSLEFEEVPDFKKIDEEEAKLAKSGQRQQVIRTRKTLLPTPRQVLEKTNRLQNENHSAQIYPANHQPLEKIQFFPIPPSPLYIHPTLHPPKNEPVDEILAPEVTEEELKSARALRPPSEGSGSLLNQVEEDEGVPKKWRDAYRLLLEWNQDLTEQLTSVKERYHKFC